MANISNIKYKLTSDTSGTPASSISGQSTSGSPVSITVSADAYTGRVAPTSAVYDVKSGTTQYHTLTISQSAKAAFVTINDSTSPSLTITADGKINGASSVTITGKSNLATLYSIVTDPNSIISVSNLTVTPSGGTAASATFGTAISGDPGASAQYDFSFTLTASGPNSAASQKTASVKIGNASSNPTTYATLSITQSATGAYIYLDGVDQDLTLDVTSGSGSFTVTSNVAWAISQQSQS